MFQEFLKLLQFGHKLDSAINESSDLNFTITLKIDGFVVNLNAKGGLSQLGTVDSSSDPITIGSLAELLIQALTLGTFSITHEFPVESTTGSQEYYSVTISGVKA